MSPERSGVTVLQRVAIIGAGVAGRSFCRQLLSRGYDVTLEDVLPSNLRAIEAELEDGLESEKQGRLLLVSTVEDAVRSADLAVDFVPDELESKLEILSMMDRMAPPQTILLTPTEILSISDLASCTYRPQQCLAVGGLSRRHAFPTGKSVSLLHSEVVPEGILLTVESFLEAVGLRSKRTLDRMPSQLAGGTRN